MNRVARLLAAVVVAAACVRMDPAFAVAQEPGERIRVTLPSSTVIGSFVEMRQDGLVLQDEGGTRSIALDAIHRIERQVERRPRTKGALIGAGSGVAVAGLLGLVNPELYEDDWLFSGAETFGLVAGTFAAIGAGVGWIAGSVIRGDGWEDMNFGSTSSLTAGLHRGSNVFVGGRIRF
ncbi:MAG: hypothetical protein OXJ54_07910 [Gemmatimonadetes bacterium]|nr:hypothetical protein [Candidatus Palauibacter rhopaloidicola]